jgi:GMP synthase (glutamine-hydrolysing)
MRENGVYCEIHPFNKVDKAALSAYGPKAVILSGGPASVHEAGSPQADPAVFDLGVPVLGICYGEHHLRISSAARSSRPRTASSAARRSRSSDSPLFEGLEREETVWMSHGDKMAPLPDGFEVIARSPNAPYAAIADEDRRFYGVQFHPEVVHTPRGTDPEELHTSHRGSDRRLDHGGLSRGIDRKIRDQVGTSKVICGLSGGVDSSVAAVLIHEAIGDQLTCVFVDTGLLAQGRGHAGHELVPRALQHPAVHVDAGEAIPRRTGGHFRPETKRKTIGRVFIEIFDRESAKIEGRRIPGPGHALSRRDRKRLASGGPSRSSRATTMSAACRTT